MESDAGISVCSQVVKRQGNGKAHANTSQLITLEAS